MDSLIAMFFTLGLLGHPAPQQGAKEPPKATVRIIPEQPTEAPMARRQRILVTNQWLRELRQLPAAETKPLTVALHRDAPDS